jgi:antirestriction protein ArdC
MANVYDIITERIIERIETEKRLPWRQPWKHYLNAESGAPQNLVSKKPYRGVNVFLLACIGSQYTTPFWLTFKQAQKLGGSIRKGQKGVPVVYWHWFEKKKNTLTNKPERVPVLKYYTVFNVDQCDGIDVPKLEAKPLNTVEAIAGCEAVFSNMPKAPKLTHGEAQAYYRPTTDTVNMPQRDSFRDAPSYYHTLFHELTHATGHESRLGRLKTSELRGYGSEPYAKEELVAELGACFLSGHCGIEATQEDQSVAYLQGWLSALRKDPKLIVQASAQAQKAADYILGVTFEEESD